PLPMIIMLTSSDQFGDAQRCRDMGVATHLVKPVRQSALRDAIVAAFDVSRRPAEQETRTPQPPSEPGLRILLAEDNVVNQRVAMGHLTKAGHSVTLAENGKVALDAIENAT